ncbi:MAG TPA: preprotein translocase subunit SecE [Cellvibrionaceae bacterium]|nr:preprotein translocase subunit SecE [Cellvibrionaceae bacterium]HMY40202.1 preprotein translocase subunit SecE [Marinagarivorans sp.]HNG59406.1 preprotein translocase subunit SecE [Cellvibrionaceae bacterium]
MTTKVEAPEFRLDFVKWLVIVALIALAVFGNSYFSDKPVIVRVIGVILLGAAAVGVALFTEKGHAFLGLLKAARIELRKVVWPTKPEANQTTLLVLGVVAVASLILALIDSILGWITSQVIQ